MKRINLSLTSLLYAAIVLCSLRPLYLNAQQNDSIPPLEWGVTYGGPAYTSPWDMEVDKLGSTISVGRYLDSIDLDPGSTSNMIYSAVPSGSGSFIQKLDKDGNLAWAYSINDSVANGLYEVSVASDGSIFILGAFFGDSIDVDPDPNKSYFIYGTPVTGGATTFISKFSPVGQLIWSLSHANGPDDMYRLCADNNGGVYLMGSITDSADTDPDPSSSNWVYTHTSGTSDLFIEKITPSGQQDWFRIVQGPGNIQGIRLSRDINQGVVAGGHFTNTIDFDPGAGTQNLVTGNNETAFVLKLKSNGDYNGAFHFQGTGTSSIEDLQVDKDGNVLVGGKYNSAQVDFDPGSGVVSPVSTPKFSNVTGWFLAKYTSAGNFSWAKPYYTESVFSNFPFNYFRIALGRNGSVYTTGQIQNGGIILERGSTPAQDYELPNFSNSFYGFITKHDSSGHVLWGHALISTQSVTPRNIVFNGKSIYTMGQFKGDLEMNPYGNQLASTTLHQDAYVLKLTELCSTVPTVQNYEGCDSLLAPNGVTYYQDVSYMDTLVDVYGCDSLVMRNIDIVFVDTMITNTLGSGQLVATQQATYYQWFDCSTDSLIPNSDSPIFTPKQSGSYGVIITNGNCTDTSSCHSFNFIGLRETPAKGKHLFYPNPTHDLIYLDSELKGLNEIRVYDLSGRMVLKAENKSVVSLESLAFGTYLIRVDTHDGSMVQTIVKQ